MKKIQSRKVSENLFELDGPIILEENRNSRRIFHGQVAKATRWGVGNSRLGGLRKKGPSGWHEVENVQTVSDLQGGELLKLELRTEHVRKLYQGLTVLYEASEIVGGARRSAKLVVGKAEELVHVPQEYKSIIEGLIAEKICRILEIVG